jgi:hypothetical protein
LLVLGAALLVQSPLYDQEVSLLWQQLFAPFEQWLAALTLLCAALLGTLLILTGRRATMGRWQRVPSQLMPFLACSGLAYVATYCLSGGYVNSGYLTRLCPLPIFATQTLMALGWFVVIANLLTLAQRPARATEKFVVDFVAIATASLLVVLITSWIWVQLTYYRTTRPDELKFISRLEPLRANGVVSNSYAVPFGLAAGTWGYSSVERLLTPADANQFPYLWLADRRTNSQYLRPEIYVCFVSKSSMLSLTPGGPLQSGCSANSVISSVADGSQNGQIIARDDINDRWAIVRLSWPSDGK